MSKRRLPLFKVALLLLWFLVSLEHVCSWSLLGGSKEASASAPRPSLLVGDKNNINNRVEQAQTLLQHLKHGNSHFHPGIKVVSVGGDECGIQLQKLKQRRQVEEEDVIFVDRGEFITPQCGLHTSVGQALQWHLSQKGNSIHAHTEKLPHMYLAIYVTLYKQGLLELEPSSVVADYLITLPSSLEHLPIFWQDNMLKELQCCSLQQGVKSRREEWRSEFVLVQTALQEVGLTRLMDALSLHTWYWARSIITSRAFVDSGNDDQPCLCPYVDMMNHVTSLQSQENEEVVQCTWDIDSKGYHLRIPQVDTSSETDQTRIPNHAPRLEISYGKHSNAQFLMNYGFSVADDVQKGEHTGEDIVMLPLMLPNAVHEVEMESLWEADGLGDCHSIARNVTVGIGESGPMESVLSLCRVASAQQRELSSMKANFKQRDQRTDQCEDGLVPQMGATLCRSPFSVTNEIRALQMLQDASMSALQRYSTTLEQDSDMLQAGIRWEEQTSMTSPPSRLSAVAWIRSLWRGKPAAASNDDNDSQWRNAIRVRREEKKILRHYFQLASIGINFLEPSGEDDDNSDDDNVEQFETYKGMLEASLHDREPLPAM
jgi:hypothetical protein